MNCRAKPDSRAAIAKACPRGVDVYVDHTGGPIYDAVMRNLATGARIVMINGRLPKGEA